MARHGAAEVALLLAEIGQRLQLRGGNPYRSRAYSRAAENLMTLTMPLDRVIAEGRLQEIPGVGAAIADIIATLHRTGTHPLLEDMRSEFPATALELLRVPGLHVDKVMKLYKELGITSLAELEQAAKQDRLKQTKGFGPAFQAKMLQSLEMMRKGQGQRHLHRAEELLDAAAADLRRSYPTARRVTVAGDFRRGLELVSDLALVAEMPSRNAAVEAPSASRPIAVTFTEAAHYGAALLHATGSVRHLEALRAHAAKKGFELNEKGLFRDGKRVAARTEEELYAALELPFIPPEMREDGSEIARANTHGIPALVTDDDIRGLVHSHTTESDGVHTLEQMAKAARDRGYAYMALSDHSQTASYAGGMTEDEVRAQQALADRMNRGFRGKFRIFKGVESDILADGALDYPCEFLPRFEFIIASVHSRFRMERKEQTERILRAVANPFTTVLGHITGRQLLRRPGYEIDVEKILKACADHGVAVELNANPWRLDLDWRWCQRALELGCLVSIDADAHSTSEIDNTRWGVLMARKGGVPKDRVLNCLDAGSFAKHIEQRRQAALASLPKTTKRVRTSKLLTGTRGSRSARDAR